VHVRILDALGRNVEQRQYFVEHTLMTPMQFEQKLTAGVYMIEFSFDNQIITERFVVE
jgi:hypothetical protein